MIKDTSAPKITIHYIINSLFHKYILDFSLDLQVFLISVCFIACTHVLYYTWTIAIFCSCAIIWYSGSVLASGHPSRLIARLPMIMELTESLQELSWLDMVEFFNVFFDLDLWPWTSKGSKVIWWPIIVPKIKVIGPMVWERLGRSNKLTH